jgi:splicing factor 3B subunit 1
MENITRTHEDIEAQIREIQSKKKEIPVESNDKGVGLGESGFFDSEIYDGGGGKGKYEGYVTSIAANDEIDEEEEDVGYSQKRTGLGAPVALLNDVAQSDKDYDPFADKRRPTIADREDEYRQKRRLMIISPERVDPFADGE